MKKGQLIVIEGVDGSGKTTQTNLLISYLKSKNIPVMLVDFPQYEGFYGQIVAKYLRGEFGSIQQTSPFLISIIFALDRSTIKDKMIEFLKNGGTIVANRYATSNMAHLAANMEDENKQKEFLDWIQELEYGQMKLPKEDTVVYLYMPWQLATKLSEQKLETGNHHDYLQGKFDIHEKDIQHRRETEEIYFKLCKMHDHWKKIDCIDENGSLLSPNQIHKKIVEALNLQTI